MELFTLDSLLRRESVIDRFESLIWTERFAAPGDFELDIPATTQARTLLQPGVRLSMNESFRVMEIKTSVDKFNADGQKVLSVKGVSLEQILEDRVARPGQTSMTTNPTWKITGTPSVLMRKIFHDICVTGILNPLDIIENVQEVTFMQPSTIAEPIDPINVDLPPKTVLQALTDLAEVWVLGFRLLRNADDSILYWDVYAGSDRTSGQSSLDPVIFAPELDNLQNTTELTSIDDAKNVAYVYCPDGFEVVYPLDVDPGIDGLDRRILLVVADDIRAADVPDLTIALTQRGREELSQHRAFQAFDGEIAQRSQYRYQRDYNLGDVVEVRNANGVSNRMRVTEQIFVSDREGERSYPTLVLNTFVNTGSWLSSGVKTWFDYDSDPVTWSEMP